MHLLRKGSAANNNHGNNQPVASDPLTNVPRYDSAELLQQLATSSDPMWIFNIRTFAFLVVNDTAIRRYGFSQEEFLSMTILDIRPSEDIVPLVRQGLRDRKHDSDNEPWRHRTRDGSVFEVEITSRAITFQGAQAEIVLVREVEQHFTASKRNESGL